MMEGRCFLFLLFLLVPALTQDPGCPADYVDIDGCCYYFSTEKVSYAEASYDCEYMDGELVTFDDCETLEDVIESGGENCPYWIHPTTDLDCLEGEPEDINKYICKVDKVTECEQYCGGTCTDEFRDGCITPEMNLECQCPEGQYCCPERLSCRVDCGGECLPLLEDQNNLGCNGYWKSPADCPCPYGMGCCCRYPDIPPPPPPVTPCPETEKPPMTDDNGCGLVEQSTIPEDKVFSFEAMYEAMMEYRSDQFASDVRFDETLEQFKQLGNQEGKSLADMSGDLTDTVKAIKDVWVLEYIDSETGYEIGIMLNDFDPQTGVLPEEPDFTDPAFSNEFKDKLALLKQRYAAMKLSVNIRAFIPDGCDFIAHIQLTEHFSLVRMPLLLVACVRIECLEVIVIPVICFDITCIWRGQPYCYWEFRLRLTIKRIIIYKWYWLHFWWLIAFPPIAIQPLPVCPADGIGDIPPFEEFKPGLMTAAMNDFQSSLPDDVAAELDIEGFRAVYDMDLGEQDGTALSTMEGSVTDRVTGFKDRWALAYRESDDDMETTILLDESFDPEAGDELPDEYDLGDLLASSYSQRFLTVFKARYIEMRASVTLQAIFPTDCGTGVYSLRLDLRFRLLRLPFFLIACWEIRVTEFLIVPVLTFEIFDICGCPIPIPVFRLLLLWRSFWLGLWIAIPAPCPWPPMPLLGTHRAFGNPTGLLHGDTCEYACDRGWEPCFPSFNPLVCLWGTWWFQRLQLQCTPTCPPDPPPGFGAVLVGSFPVWNAGFLKRACFYDCFPGWVPWWGSFWRDCFFGVWFGSPLICFPPWWIIGGGGGGGVGNGNGTKNETGNPLQFDLELDYHHRDIYPPPGDPNLPTDCKDIQNIDPALPSGIYMIYPRDNQPGFLVYCDMETDGGGWTVIQRRQDGSVDFYRGWDDYKHGFSLDNMTGEFWLGNDKIHRITVGPPQFSLRVDMEADDGDTAYAEYNWFGLANEANNYWAVIAGYSGTAGDSMLSTTAGLSLNGMDFSTHDDDNDKLTDGSCAVRFKGAWWYNACGESNLNGEYGNDNFGKGVVWKTFRGMRESLKFTEMKVRPQT